MKMAGAADLVLITLSHNVSFMGKTWLLLMLGFRSLLVLLAGFSLFGDEQERFVCNTIQPGCSNLCFNVFCPVSILRLWLFHLLLLLLPHLVFFTTILEAAFGAGQFFLFGLTFPKSFLCYEAPCTSGIECYVSRPTEKSLMLNFMLAVAALSIFLSFVDLASSLKAMVRWRKRQESLMEEMSKGEQSSVFTSSEDMDNLLTKRGSPNAKRANGEGSFGAQKPEPSSPAAVARLGFRTSRSRR
ncbi:hypothetical protein WMY93_000375 [Mugilogobius chulae]|uniref:Gap junction protein n=1 Tax=Mugilogobius chulae TaxID=88201 RepID=A0AAW0Q1Z6_9GOBI